MQHQDKYVEREPELDLGGDRMSDVFADAFWDLQVWRFRALESAAKVARRLNISVAEVNLRYVRGAKLAAKVLFLVATGEA